eukprot:615316-Rhodomonas_salina.3
MPRTVDGCPALRHVSPRHLSEMPQGGGRGTVGAGIPVSAVPDRRGAAARAGSAAAWEPTDRGGFVRRPGIVIPRDDGGISQAAHVARVPTMRVTALGVQRDARDPHLPGHLATARARFVFVSGAPTEAGNVVGDDQPVQLSYRKAELGCGFAESLGGVSGSTRDVQGFEETDHAAGATQARVHCGHDQGARGFLGQIGEGISQSGTTQTG